MPDLIQLIITGSTGMVGEGVLHECLDDKRVSNILVINRRPCGISHAKLKEIIQADFYDFSSIEQQLSGYDACLFCLGVSSIGMNEDKYNHLTYDLTMHVAHTLSRINDQMNFCYISGSGTDSSEKGRTMWARVKGKTENSLLKLPFKNVYNFRPAVLVPTPGLRNTLKFYRYLGWMIPLLKVVMPNSVCSLQQLGKAMINAVISGYSSNILEVKDIKLLAKMQVA